MLKIAALLGALTQAKVIVKAFSMNLISKVLLSLLALTLFTSCVSIQNSTSKTPSWYISPKQNDAKNLYGISQGFTLEEATKSALADSASRLMVSISSESTSISQESKFDIREETRRQIKQNIEKINFTNFRVTRSAKFEENFFVEVEIGKFQFVTNQKEKLTFLETKVSNLEKTLKTTNPIQKRVSLSKIVGLSKEIELKSRILNGAGENINLREKLSRLANFENQLNSVNRKIEFYLTKNSSKRISQIVKTALNKEKITISKTHNSKPNQITITIKSNSKTSKIYGAYITKLRIDFENSLKGKIIASNSIEVTGSSTLGEKEAYSSATKSLENKISKENILKIIGIIN